MLFFLVGNMLACCRKKLNVSSLYLEGLTNLFLSGVVDTSQDF